MKHEGNNVVAVFIDADNAPAKKIDFIIGELANHGWVMVRRIYGNWKNESLKNWEEILLSHALTPIQRFDYTKGKNATDMALTIDVMDFLYSGKVDVFGIVSSDCDFTPLVMRIKEEGKKVIGFGERKTPQSLVCACNQFLFLDDEKSISKKEDNPKEEHHSAKQKTGNQLKQDTALMNLLRKAVNDCCDENGWANLGRLGQIINNQSSFDSRNYGYGKLSALIKAIDIFETKTLNNQVYVRNKRNK